MMRSLHVLNFVNILAVVYTPQLCFCLARKRSQIGIRGREFRCVAQCLLRPPLLLSPRKSRSLRPPSLSLSLPPRLPLLRRLFLPHSLLLSRHLKKKSPKPATEAAVAEPAKEEAKTDAVAEVPKKEERPRSPGILSKLLAPFKETRKQVEKRVKAPKSPKKEKQKDEIEPAAPAEAVPAEAKAEEPAKVEEAPAAEEVPAAEAVKETETAPVVEETPVPVEPAAESAPAETAVAEAPKEDKVDEKKEKDVKAMKVSRRISARVTEFFKPKKAEVNAPAKVDENPPVIDQPTPLPPLEHPATDATAAPTTEQPVESSEPAPAAAPVIAAAA
ncbi:hypothetical protein EV363DRAFT_749909 [Boletus edulis]|nr:hypothetical protein EV363DRAFT_749909 [Boletus edulis]